MRTRQVWDYNYAYNSWIEMEENNLQVWISDIILNIFVDYHNVVGVGHRVGRRASYSSTAVFEYQPFEYASKVAPPDLWREREILMMTRLSFPRYVE